MQFSWWKKQNHRKHWPNFWHYSSPNISFEFMSQTSDHQSLVDVARWFITVTRIGSRRTYFDHSHNIKKKFNTPRTSRSITGHTNTWNVYNLNTSQTSMCNMHKLKCLKWRWESRKDECPPCKRETHADRQIWIRET